MPPYRTSDLLARICFQTHTTPKWLFLRMRANMSSVVVGFGEALATIRACLSFFDGEEGSWLDTLDSS